MSIALLFLALSLVSNSWQQSCSDGSGGCQCACNCNQRPTGPTTIPPTSTVCPPCPTGGGNGTTPSDQCDNAIRWAAVRFQGVGAILGELLRALLSQLVVPVLQIVLTGNNTVEGALIPLLNVLCYIVGLILLLLQELGALGLLGPGGLLQNLLGGLLGGILG